MKKRLLSILLMCCMVLTLLPTAVFAEGETDVSINETNFPDANFRTVVKEYDTDKDENLSRAEIEAVKEIECYYKDIRSLTGIEYFTALQTLKCYSNQLTSLDISGNTALKSLDCAKNQLAALDVSQNTALESLNCADNQVTSLDISQNTALEYLICASNKLTALNVSGNATLKFLNCESNELTALDVNRNTALNTLNCLNNRLTSLNVSLNLNLQDLNCARNQLSALDVQKNTALKSLYCGYNQLTVLDVGQNRSLESLSCNNNLLTSLNVSQNTRLNLLHCFNNHLTSLDTSNQKRLHTLSCNNNNYPITITNDRNYDLSDLPGTFDVNKASNWSGGTVSGNILTVDHDKDGVTYTYDCGNGKTANFTLTVENKVEEQFTLTPGGRYYFDLSAMNIPGTVNSNLPDSTLHYVPFTYVGTVNAYRLTSETATTEEYAQKNKYPHSLFIADYAVTHTVSWDDLNTAGLIFGKDYAAGGVDYTLRAPSVGSSYTGSGDSERGTPKSNEWDKILDKDDGYIKNWREMLSCGQDTTIRISASFRAVRGWKRSARFWTSYNTSYSTFGFRPVLEVLNPDTLSSDGLKAVTLDLGGGTLGNSSDAIQIIVKNGESFTAPATEGLSRPNSISEDAQLYWSDENGNCYKPGDTVPADVSRLSITGDYEVIYLSGTYGAGSAVTDMKPHNNILTLRGALFTRKGYTQVGWSTVDGGEKVYGFEDVYTQNEALTLYPVWNANQYTITFDTNGGSEIAPITQDYGTGITAPDNPTRKGYTFKGWDKEIPETMPAENMTVKAQWEINQYTIAFDTNGGSEIAPITQDYGTEITAPDNPTRKGYTFKGWDKEIPETMPAENITVKAQWEINQYTIAFDTNGGSEIAPITQDYGTEITAPDNPTRKGYTFKGWHKEIPETMPAENITITARWKDTEKPTGEIIIGTNKWNEFLNELTFGIFFKDTQEVTINAVDNSGVVFVSYLVTDKELSEAELNSLVFRAYEEPFCIDPNGEYIVYVMLVDENINITYLRSDRITLDNIQPVISGIENGKTYCEAQTVTVDEKYVDTVTVNGTVVTLDADGGFVLPPTNGEQKIVVTDKAGNNAEMTVTVNNGHTFGEWVSDNDGKHTRKCTVDGCDAFETENCSGGNATCTEKAVCDVCGKAYGEFDGTNHEGGVQEWTTRTAFNHEQKWNCCGAVIVASEAHEWKDGVCRECGYVCLHNDADKDHICDYCKKTISEHVDKDKDHICDYCKKTISAHEDAPTEEIKKADTVTAKLPDDSKSPQTGDNSNLILWIALLIISGGVMKGVTAFGKSKKHSAKIKDK